MNSLFAIEFRAKQPFVSREEELIVLEGSDCH